MLMSLQLLSTAILAAAIYGGLVFAVVGAPDRVTRMGHLIDLLNNVVGSTVACLTLVMVLVQFALVLMRYIFGVGSIFMQESVVFMHGIVFMAAVGYTLYREGHVRVDIIYRTASPKTKGWIDALGVAVLMVPVCLLIVHVSQPYVAAAWRIFEGSRETSGLPGWYLYKTLLLVFPTLLALQGLALASRAILTLRGHPVLPYGTAPAT
jgi:TRAP-type mannitol/chloroaromatic compound transport system permease small subunit